MKPYNFETRPKEGESTDRVIKRFLKKTSKSKLIQQCAEKMYFLSNSQKKRNKKSRKKYIKQKIQEAHLNELKNQSNI